MEEEDLDEGKTVKEKCPKKLINLNAPLLSTRRTNNICMDRLGDSWDRMISCERIPFSWEQIPGKPKKDIITEVAENDHYLPPRPPPGRWQLMIETEAATAACWECCNYASNNFSGVGSGDEDVNDVDGGVSTNALDIFSLAQSVETNETQDRARSTLSSTEEEEERTRAVKMVSPSTNFMIQRFLPDAKALAAASSSAFNINHENNNKCHLQDILRISNYGCDNNSSNISRTASLRQSSPFSSSKGGCGLDNFLPWRVKPKSRCGMKSPVMALPTARLPWNSREKYK